MGDRDDYKSRKRYDDDRRKKRYDDDDRDYYERRDRRREPKKGAIERILTPGNTANNVIKTAATGIIAGGTILLMGVYGAFGSRLVGAEFLPMATAVSSAVATACVWIFGRPKTEEAYNEEFTILRKELRSINENLDEVQAHNTELEKRLANVELLETFEDKLAKHTLEKEMQALNPLQTKPSPSPISSNMPSSSEDTSHSSSSMQRETE
ncbi:MAG: hypothetical protein ACSHX6_00575 [Akkermansiaceae bacterium]